MWGPKSSAGGAGGAQVNFCPTQSQVTKLCSPRRGSAGRLRITPWLGAVPTRRLALLPNLRASTDQFPLQEPFLQLLEQQSALTLHAALLPPQANGTQALVSY